MKQSIYGKKLLWAVTLNFFLLSIYSCNDKDDIGYLWNKTLSNHSNSSASKSIPLTQSGKPGTDFMFVREMERYLSLNNLYSERTDSFELRVWYNLLEDSTQLFVVKYGDEGWHSELTKFSVSRESIKDSFRIEKTSKQTMPARDWNSFLHAMINYNILDLPDQDSLRGYELATEGSVMTFEVASKNFYRMYSYATPKLNMTKFNEVKTAMSFVDFLNIEFNLSLPSTVF